MTKEMMNAMKEDKISFFNVSSNIKVIIPVANNTEKYVNQFKKLFDANLDGAVINNNTLDGTNNYKLSYLIESNCKENKDIVNILDDIVKIAFSVKEELEDDEKIVIIINGKKTVI